MLTTVCFGPPFTRVFAHRARLAAAIVVFAASDINANLRKTYFISKTVDNQMSVNRILQITSKERDKTMNSYIEIVSAIGVG